MPCEIYMGATDIERQAPNVARMKLLGAKLNPVTSGAGRVAQLSSHPANMKTRAGRPATTGALRVAASRVGEGSAEGDCVLSFES